jgi:hypothetical protein
MAPCYREQVKPWFLAEAAHAASHLGISDFATSYEYVYTVIENGGKAFRHFKHRETGARVRLRF